MSEENLDRIPESPTPVRVERNDSDSSRGSASPIRWDWDSRTVSDSPNPTGRMRRSSWDDSDEEGEPKPADVPYEQTAVKNSISSELNELKEQFFQFLERENSIRDSFMIEHLRERLDLKGTCDRRHSPARVRRRSRSSSSSSPVPESQSRNSPELREKRGENEDAEENGASPKAATTDSRHYLNNFFSELRSRRISMLEPVPVTDRAEKEGELLCDGMKLEMLNELSALEVNEDGGYFCKTSRKLSQILEVEENRKDLEKGSDETVTKPETLAEHKTSQGNEYLPLPTARNKKTYRFEENARESSQKDGTYKSQSAEDFGEILTVGNPSRGSLSERCARIFTHKMEDDFIQLCAKTGKTRLTSPKEADDPDVEKPFQFLCLTGILGANREFSVEPLPRGEESGNNSKYSPIDLDRTTGSGSPSPRKSTERTKSGKSRGGSIPQSPKFRLSFERDSARSLGVEENGSKACLDSKVSSEECSGRKSNKSSHRSEEVQTERSIHLAIHSPSGESTKTTSRSDRGVIASGGRSGRKPERKRVLMSGGVEKVDSPVGSGRSLRKSSGRSESSTKSMETPEENFFCFGRTPRSQEIPELELPLRAMERPESEKKSCRSVTTAGSENARERDHVTSDNNSSARSRRSERARRSTARSVKKAATPRRNNSDSVRSKESAENPQASAYDGLVNRMSLSSSSSGGSWREINAPTQQPSRRSSKPDRTPEYSGTRETFTPKVETLEERLFSGRKSSARSADSHGRASSTGTFANVSPSKSERMRSRPSSLTSDERKRADFPEFEKLDVDISSGRTSNRSLPFEEDEERTGNLSSHRSRNGTESDRRSSKRLSIINEASVEDFQTGNTSTENEETQAWDRTRPPTRRDSKRASSRSRESAGTSETFGSHVAGGSPPTKQSDPDGGNWTELIETFEGTSNPPHLSGQFPGFPPQTEENSQALTTHSSSGGRFYDSEDVEVALSQTKVFGGRGSETPRTEMKKVLGDRQREKDFSFSVVYKEPFVKKPKSGEEKSVRGVQNLYFVEVDEGGRFGMGEFGDVRCWSAGEPDNQEPEKPRDDGDGRGAFKSSEVLTKPERKEKETKIPRQLWTEIKEDFRESEVFSSLFPGSEMNAEFTGVVPGGVKTSKSDNCIRKNACEGIGCENSAISDFLCEYKELEGFGSEAFKSCREIGADPPEVKNAEESSSSGDEDSGKEEFNCEITPRLSRSMPDVHTQLHLDRSNSNELKETSESSSAQLLENFNLSTDGESGGAFPTREKDENTGREPNNWLSVSRKERKKSGKREKRGRKGNRSSGSSGEQLVRYLSSRKTVSSVPSIKLRKSNCFQNFYKRFISVFCVTSHSSAATSK